MVLMAGGLVNWLSKPVVAVSSMKAEYIAIQVIGLDPSATEGSRSGAVSSH